MRSRFKFFSFILLILTLLDVGFFSTFIIWAFQHADQIIAIFIFEFFFFVLTIWGLTREIKYKLNVVEIDHNAVLVKSFYGIAPTKKIFFSEITSISATIESGRISSEATYIYVNDKRRVEISSEYYSNYSKIADELRQKTGLTIYYEPFSVLTYLAKLLGFPVKWNKENENSNGNVIEL